MEMSSDVRVSAPHLQNCHLRGCAQRWMILVTDERSSELSLTGKASDKLSTVQFPSHDSACDQADARTGDQALRLWVSQRKKCERWSGTKRCVIGLFDGLGPNRGARQWQLRS
jgi:hypothetical protein